jgi:hypothetical protein
MKSASESKILSCELNHTDIKLSEWKDKGQFVTIKSHQIFYVVEGEGPELLLLHAYPTASWGWHRMWPYPTASWGWHRMWPELVRHFRVVAPDLLGSGFSDKPPGGDYSITYLTDVVEELLSKLKQPKNLSSVRVFHKRRDIPGSSQNDPDAEVSSYFRGRGRCQEFSNPVLDF